MHPLAALLLALFCLLSPPAALAQQGPAPVQNGAGQAETTEAPPEALSPSDAARLLADVISDPEARAALVEELRTPEPAPTDEPAAQAPAEPGAASESAPAPAETTAAPAPGDTATPAAPAPGEGEVPAAETPSVEQSITAAVATHTLGFAEAVAVGARTFWAEVTDFEGMRARLAAVNWPSVQDAVEAVGIVVVVTLGIFAVLRVAARRPRGRFGAAVARRAAERNWVRRLIAVTIALVIDIAILLLAWTAGYAVAIAVGDAGRMDLRQSLFLNAFLAVELVKAAMRLVLAPKLPTLRFWAMGDDRARRLYRGSARITEVLGYGMLLAAPVARRAVSWNFGETVERTALLIAGCVAIAIILRNRTSAASTLMAKAARYPDGLLGMGLALLARVWHVLAIAYVLAVLLVWSSQPFDSLGFVVKATLHSGIAILVGTVLMLVLTRVITGGIRLPERLDRAMPALGGRLNTYVPAFLAAGRLLILVAVIGAILRAWDIFDLAAWLTETEMGRHVTEALVSAGVILLAGAVFWVVSSSWIEFHMMPSGNRVPTAREQTLLALLRNGIAVAVAVVTLMLVLSAIGVNIAPLLAGAGVFGLAVGFGAQTLVKDIITGAFIQLENAMNTGDTVTVGGVTGTVERLTIRSVSLRDASGTYHLIPFSSVTAIANFSKDFAYYVAEVVIGRGTDVERVKEIMHQAFDELRASPAGAPLAGPFDMQGVASFTDATATVQARIMTRAGRQWAVGRAYNEFLTRKLDAARIYAEPAAPAPVPA
ncbi:mechanosensitive ion channel domain-containing protein [Amaricoccus sp. W119]|uniref:mechanosensitive ion channel domain-containing protein n=1 Tax=Amaricoccus sp. W119 TaxID=3391833 RepID=UPI0039A4F468